MKKIYLILFLIFSLLSLSGWTKPSKSIQREIFQKYSDKLLHKILLTEKDLGFEKKYSKDDFRLKIVDDILDEPYLLIDVIESIDKNITDNLSDLSKLYNYFIDYLDFNEITFKLESKISQKDIKGVPEELKKFIFNLVRIYDTCNILLKESTKEIYNDNLFRTFAEEFILENWDNSLSPLKKEDIKDFSEQKFLEKAKSIDINQLLKSFDLLLSTYTNEIESMKNFKYSDKNPKIITTPVGKVIIGSSNDDVYTEKVFMIIDFSGDDIYRDESCKSNFIFDFSGDDFYTTKFSSTLGSGVFDYSIFEDFKGNDVYKTINYSLGCGYFGVGIFIDDEGNDIYESDQISQGAALFGVGLLIDREGNDRYGAAEYSQGFSQTKGLGALIDVKGNDTYFSGGKYLHQPLYSDIHRSLSQGMSIGFRPNASGGVAILWDGEGNDKYDGQVYIQGAGYWFSLGVLIDKSGNDSYTGHIYGQGGGIHLAVGGLYDKDGMDMFSLIDGVGQGGAHDWAVAGLLNLGKNNDLYTGSGIVRGSAHANGVGFFLDEGGNDVYTGKKINPEQNGFGTRDRDSISVGIFLDLAGIDSYYPNGRDNQEWQTGFIGIGYDEQETKQKIKKEDETEQKLEKLSYPQDKEKIDEMYKIATQWGVGTNIKTVPQAQKILAHSGPEVIEYIFKEHIKSPTTLEIRALTVIAKENKEKVLSLFKEFIDSKDPDKIKGCFSIMVGLPITYDELEKYGFTQDYLKDLIEDYGIFIYSILGNTHDNKVINTLLWSLDSQKNINDKTWVSLMLAIGKTGNIKESEKLLNYINDELPAIRRYAIEDSLKLIFSRFPDFKTKVLRLWKSNKNHTLKDIHLLRACVRADSDRKYLPFYIKILRHDIDQRARLYATEGIRRIMRLTEDNYYFDRIYELYKEEKDILIQNKLKEIIEFITDPDKPNVDPY